MVTASVSLDPASRFFTEAEARPIVIVPEVAGDRAREKVGSVADVVEAGHERVDLREAVVALGARGARVVLSEGGPTVLAELVSNGVLDEFCMTVAPYLGGEPGNVVDRPLPRPIVDLDLVHAVQEDGEVFLRYLVRH